MSNQVIEIDASNGSKEEKFSNRWWTYKKEEMFKHVFGTVKTIETRQSYRTQDNIRHARLYSDLEVLGAYAGLYNTAKGSVMPNRLTLNVIKACVDTVTSKIAKTKPRPMFLTEGGDYTRRMKSKNLTKFMDGQFDLMGHYEVKQKTFRDSCIFGTGFTKLYIDWDTKQIKSERVVPEEMLVDDAEAIYGRPQSLYQRRLVNKDILIAAFPSYAGLIREASAELKDSVQWSPGTADLVKVIEAWHLKSGPNATDGVHTICINNCTLQMKSYKHDEFPFSKETWNDSVVGYFGIGIAREITGIQIEINKILMDIQKSMHLFAVPRVFLQNGSIVNQHAINNDIGAIVKYSGTMKPEFYTPQAMAPDVYQHLWSLYAKAYEICGISQLSATSKKPEGLDSGAALREYSDIESDRFQIVGQRREESFLFDTKMILLLAKDLQEEDPSFKVMVADQGSSKTIKFKDVMLKDDEYISRIFPASILPTQPAAKMQTIVEYAQAGFIDKDTAMDLMDFPDIEQAAGVILAPRRIVLKMLDGMVEEGEYQPPEPYMDLQLCQSLSQNYYLHAKQIGVPEDRLELIRRFMDQVVSMQQQAMAAMMPPPGAMPGLPAGAAGPEQAMPAVPEAAPTNPMLPQA